MGGGSFGVFIGKMEQSDDIDQRQTRQVGSTIGALSGDVTLIADHDLTIRASDVLARTIDSQGGWLEGRNITLAAEDAITLRSAENHFRDDSDSQSSSAGIGPRKGVKAKWHLLKHNWLNGQRK